MKKYILMITFIFLALNGFVMSAHAAINPTKIEERMEARTTIMAQKQSDLLTRVIQRADQLIATRLASLQRLLARLQSDKRLSDTDKTSLTNDINTTISSLNALKTKIDADTDETTARADAKSIITSYKIFVIYEPKIRLLTTIGNLQALASNMTSLSTQVQTLTNDLKAQGKDVTAAQTALNDITTQLTAINTTLATDKTLVTNVTVNTTDPHSVFVQVRKDLATVRPEFAKIRSDFATLRQFFKINLPKGTVSLKPSPASESAK